VNQESLGTSLLGYKTQLPVGLNVSGTISHNHSLYEQVDSLNITTTINSYTQVTGINLATNIHKNQIQHTTSTRA